MSYSGDDDDVGFGDSKQTLIGLMVISASKSMLTQVYKKVALISAHEIADTVNERRNPRLINEFHSIKGRQNCTNFQRVLCLGQSRFEELEITRDMLTGLYRYESLQEI